MTAANLLAPRFFSTLYSLRRGLLGLWRGLRQATGDDAYERYLQRWHAGHGHAENREEPAESAEPAEPPDQPLDRKTFHKRRLDEDWNQPRRCC